MSSLLGDGEKKDTSTGGKRFEKQPEGYWKLKDWHSKTSK